MKAELTLIPKISIHPTRINYYQECNWNPGRPSKYKPSFERDYNSVSGDENSNYSNRKFNHLLTSKRSASGMVSNIAKRKISKALEYMLYLAPGESMISKFTGRKWQFKVVFVTMTLSAKQMHTDNEIKEKLLNQFLVECRKYYKVKNYVWRAEKQLNGSIHFHIVFDRHIPYEELRYKWNRIQKKLGYIDEYRKRMEDWHKDGFQVRKDLLGKWNKQAQYNAWKKGVKTKWNDPNSTDVHSLRKVLNIKAYLTKYITKQPTGKNKLTGKETLEEIKKIEDEQKKLLVSGRIWGCSYELSDIKGCQLEIDNLVQNDLDKLFESKKFNEYKGTYFTVTLASIADIESAKCDLLIKKFMAYLLDTFGYSHQYKLSG